ncbi:acyl-CoA dehydrogenase family protein [Kocuria sp.]|uniref:acyl-CoA dehydrogenase family protein n=1 Tax=Kocuria sp. TaxID=1871328 RepID=UPI0026E018EF|nr:acyl-CoA dehydrogenase family protein [Kocuria sp.]MDO5618856.1 acyl-CoA dehydrogenase family protein [Kocuria sp.]
MDKENTVGAPQNYRLNEYLETDFLGVFTDVDEADRAHWDRAKQFAEETIPVIGESWHNAEYPLDLVKRMGELHLFTDGLEIPGLEPMSALAAGLVTMEISRADGSMGAAAAVQGGLVLRSLAFFASDEQKEKWLLPVATAEVLGSFALTEPDHGSDSVSLETTAAREGDEWVLNGHKRWIGNGASGGITIVWARDVGDNQVKGFIVEQDTPGYTGVPIAGKGAIRAIHQADITLEDVRVPASHQLPGVQSFKDVSKVLSETRLSVGWSALGHGLAMFEAALNYSKQRVQFGKPLATKQMVQERLAQMLEELTNMQLQCVQATSLQAAGTLRPQQASLVKYHNTRAARRIASIARDLLGGNGILLENHVIRHLLDVEAIHTYEGTESVQALILGRELTGYSAFA